MRMCNLETSVTLPSVVGALLALVLVNSSSCRMGREENTKLISGTSCVKNEIIPRKVQWKAGLLWQANEVFSLLSSFIWEERCFNYVLHFLVLEGYTIFMEKVTHCSLNPVFISKQALLSLKKSSCCWIKTSILKSSVPC